MLANSATILSKGLAVFLPRDSSSIVISDLKKHALVEDQLSSESKAFSDLLFARLPHLRPYAQMFRADVDSPWALIVTVPSPSGDPDSDLVIWTDNAEEPSIGFGQWHTHENCCSADGPFGIEDDAVLKVIERLLRDEYVVFEEIGPSEVPAGVLLRSDDLQALAEELTAKYTTGTGRVRSWSGKKDRVLELQDAERILYGRESLDL